jgi:hypothetical protein
MWFAEATPFLALGLSHDCPTSVPFPRTILVILASPRNASIGEIARNFADCPTSQSFGFSGGESCKTSAPGSGRRLQIPEQICKFSGQEVTGADRQWAANYHLGDVVRYTKGSRTYSLAAGEYAPVVRARRRYAFIAGPTGPSVNG